MTLSVVQWGVGYAGSKSIRALARSCDLELVGAWVHSPANVGIDAGLLAGTEPTGVITTNDAEALIALSPDCVVYTARAPGREDEVVDDLAMLLRAGINVVNLAMPALFYPRFADPRFFAVLEDAAQLGGASLFTSGIDPGLGNAGLVLHGLALVGDVEQITMLHVANLAAWDNPDTLYSVMGLGLTDVSASLLATPGVLTSAWGPLVAMIADAVGVDLDSIEESVEATYCEDGFVVAAGVIGDDTVAATRMCVTGIVDAKPFVRYERVHRLREFDAPHWPKGDGFRIDIVADPRIHLELAMSSDDHNAAPVVAAVNHLHGAIPMVVAARPGIMTMLDVPAATLARGATAR